MRTRTILAAAAAPAIAAAALLATTAAASAATTPGHPAAITCTGTNPNSPQVLRGTVTGNLDVPVGTYCAVWGGEVTGNVSVEGALSASSATFDRNVAVSGPGSNLTLINNPSHIKGNLSVTGSSGDYSGGNPYMYGKSFGIGQYNQPGASQVDGNFSFDYNTGGLFVGSPLNVGGNFEAIGNGPYPNSTGGPYSNPGWFYTGGLNVTGSTTIA